MDARAVLCLFVLSLLFVNLFYLLVNTENPSLISLEVYMFVNASKETSYALEYVFAITQSLEIQTRPLVYWTLHLPVSQSWKKAGEILKAIALELIFILYLLCPCLSNSLLHGSS